MIRAASLALAFAAALSTTLPNLALAQGATPAPAQAPAGQPAGSQAQERSQGAVGGWLWPILGLAVIGGAVAAAAGGGGGGGSSAPSGTQ